MFSKSIPACAGLVYFAFTFSAAAQSSGAAGTIDGQVSDPAGAVIPGAKVQVSGAKKHSAKQLSGPRTSGRRKHSNEG